jgi:hypothetical protein
VEPDIGIEATAAEIGVADDLHVPHPGSLRTAAERLVHLLKEVRLVLEQLVVVLGRRCVRDAREGERGSDQEAHDSELSHPNPLSPGGKHSERRAEAVQEPRVGSVAGSRSAREASTHSPVATTAMDEPREPEAPAGSRLFRQG